MAAFGETDRPVRGAGTRTGDGLGDGVGLGDGDGLGDGNGPWLEIGLGDRAGVEVAHAATMKTAISGHAERRVILTAGEDSRDGAGSRPGLGLSRTTRSEDPEMPDEATHPHSHDAPSPDDDDAMSMSGGAIGAASAEAIGVSMGAVGVARATSLTVDSAVLGVMAAGEATVDTAVIGTVLARDVRLERTLAQTIVTQRLTVDGSAMSVFLVAQRIEGNVRTLFDWRGGLAFGLAFGLALGVIRAARRA